MLQKIASDQLKPILDGIHNCKERKPCADFGDLKSWAQACRAAEKAAAGGKGGSSRDGQHSNAQVEVNLEGKSLGSGWLSLLPSRHVLAKAACCTAC